MFQLLVLVIKYLEGISCNGVFLNRSTHIQTTICCIQSVFSLVRNGQKWSCLSQNVPVTNSMLELWRKTPVELKCVFFKNSPQKMEFSMFSIPKCLNFLAEVSLFGTIASFVWLELVLDRPVDAAIAFTVRKARKTWGWIAHKNGRCKQQKWMIY